MTIADSLTLLNSTKTAIREAIEDKGVTVGSIPFADYPDKIAEISGGGGSVPLEWSQAYYDAVYTTGPGAWARPDWLTLPKLKQTDQKFVGLYAVYPEGANLVAFQVQGAYTVNWGDGAVESFTSGSAANHAFSYSNPALDGTDAPVTLSGSVIQRVAHGRTNGQPVTFWNRAGSAQELEEGLTYYVTDASADTFRVAATPGGAPINLVGATGSASLLRHKQAIVSVTPLPGHSLSLVNLDYRHTLNSAKSHVASWLDVSIASPHFTNIVVGSSSSTTMVAKPVLERVCMHGKSAAYQYPSLEYRFSNLPSLKVADFSQFDTSSVFHMGNMFSGCYSLQTVSQFDTSGVLYMQNMFYNCASLQTVPQFDTSAVANMSAMFYGCRNLQTVPLLNTSRVPSMASMFSGCASLQTVPQFDTSSVTNMQYMFYNCSSLQTVPLLDTSGVTLTFGMFYGCTSLQSVPLLDTSAVLNMTSMFQNCASLQSVPLLDTSAVTNMTYMFYSCTSLRSVPLLDTSSVTNMQNMFYNCTSLRSVPLLDTSSVTNMQYMFSGCSSLQTVPQFDTSAVTTMAQMFYGCASLQSVPLLDTSAVTTMAQMFQGCTSLQSVPLLDTSGVTNMTSMFSGCTSLQSVPLLDTSVVTNVASMFSACTSLQSVPALNFSAVTGTYFSSLFSSCSALESVKATGFSQNFAVSNCSLSAAALNEIYANLPTVTGKTITVSGNYGTTGDTPSIATDKGWTVTG